MATPSLSNPEPFVESVAQKAAVYHSAAVIDGMVTCLEILQDEFMDRLRLLNGSESFEAYYEAMSTVLGVCRDHAAMIMKLAE